MSLRKNSVDCSIAGGFQNRQQANPFDACDCIGSRRVGFKVSNRCGNTSNILSGKGRLKRRGEGEEYTEGRENALLCVLSMK